MKSSPKRFFLGLHKTDILMTFHTYILLPCSKQDHYYNSSLHVLHDELFCHISI